MHELIAIPGSPLVTVTFKERHHGSVLLGAKLIANAQLARAWSLGFLVGDEY